MVNNTNIPIQPVDRTWLERAEQRQIRLTKPPRSLGRLETIANRLAAIQRTDKPKVEKPGVLIFAADHGVCEEGVNPYPREVTAQMVANFRAGGAAINAVAAAVGAELFIVDVGVGRPTKNFCKEPAMDVAQASEAILAGSEAVNRAVGNGTNVIAVGEMGIGNTTSASALTAALTGMKAEAVTGRGTGADDACMQRKIAAIARALDLHKPNRNQPIDMLARIGGFEIAAMVGAYLQAASRRCAVLIDGFISTAAAAVAVEIDANVKSYMFAGHRSTEPGQRLLLEIIEQVPIFDLEMRLGEGTGAALAIPVLRAAAQTLSGMSTFEEAGISG